MKTMYQSHFLQRNWIVPFGVFFGLLAGVPFLAPVFMQAGWMGAGKAIYLVYSFLCHQLPERSFFLYGPKFMYSLVEIQSAWQPTNNPVLLRQFLGSAEMGWKVAWSDRMVSLYTSIWLFGLLWWPLRSRLKALPWWGLALWLLPMALDGTTHFISDLAGIGRGFRDANLWLAALTQNGFPVSFYAGDAWGSFNSLMRLVTGAFFGLGIVWYAFPRLDRLLHVDD